MTTYAKIVAAGIQTDHHESDLYVLDTPEARAILRDDGVTLRPFKSELDGKRWLDCPFLYAPFWERPAPRMSAVPRKCRRFAPPPHPRESRAVPKLLFVPERLRGDSISTMARIYDGTRVVACADRHRKTKRSAWVRSVSLLTDYGFPRDPEALRTYLNAVITFAATHPWGDE